MLRELRIKNNSQLSMRSASISSPVLNIITGETGLANRLF